MKKLITLVLAMAMALSLVACGGDSGSNSASNSGSNSQSNTQEGALKVALCMSGAVNDQGWNQSAYDGAKAACDKYGYELAYTENLNAADIAAAFADYAAAGYDVIIGHGFEFGDPALEVASTSPDVTFICTEASASADNVASYVMACEQTAYVEGVIAALGESEHISEARISAIDLGTGVAAARLALPRELFYKTLSEQSGFEVGDDGDLMSLLTKLAAVKAEYDKVAGALHDVRETGYGIVVPGIDELKLEEPEIMKQGGRYGVRLKASAPSIHMIRADIETAVSPIVGNEKQCQEPNLHPAFSSILFRFSSASQSAPQLPAPAPAPLVFGNRTPVFAFFSLPQSHRTRF